MRKILTASFLMMLTVAMFAQKRSPYKYTGATLPPLRVVDRNGKAYTEEYIHQGHHFFLVLFNPTCHHCMDMARLFGAHEQEFRQNTIIFVAAGDMLPYLEHFYQETGADSFRNMVIGVDSSAIISNLYKYGTLPQINIYDKARRLVRVFGGATALDSLVRYAD